MCSFAAVEILSRPGIHFHSMNKVAFLARHWHGWALAVPMPQEVELEVPDVVS